MLWICCLLLPSWSIWHNFPSPLPFELKGDWLLHYMDASLSPTTNNGFLEHSSWLISPFLLMHTLVHNESKSTDEFIRFYSELGEFWS